MLPHGSALGLQVLPSSYGHGVHEMYCKVSETS